MKFDWDDAPDYIRNIKKQSPVAYARHPGLSSATTWGLIALFAKRSVPDQNAKSN